MQYRTLGKTGLQVSVIGYGAGPLGGVYGKFSDDEGIEAVRTAIKHGINYIDTAPYYGITKSETLLGKALVSIPRDKYILATKVARYGVDDFDFSATSVVNSVKASMKRLCVDYIDVIQVHDIEFGDLNQVIKETLPALRKLKEDGLVRNIGVTGLPIKALHTITSQTEVDLILSYCHYHLADSSLTQYIPELQKDKIGVVNASILSMGLLTLAGPPSWHPAPQELKDKCKEAAQYCDDKGYDISKLAVKWALKNKDIATNLVGMAKPEEVLQNVATVENSEITADEEKILSEVAKILAPVHGTTWIQGDPKNN